MVNKYLKLPRLGFSRLDLTRPDLTRPDLSRPDLSRPDLFPVCCTLCGLPDPGPLALCPPCEQDLVANYPRCDQCALPLPAVRGPTGLCGQCLMRPPPFDRVRAPLVYDEGMAYLIGYWKFQRHPALADLLARLWLDREPATRDVDLLVPVPLHWRRLLWRGFNQAELLCRALRKGSSVLAEIGMDTRLLQRSRATPAQSRLGLGQRRANLAAAFTIRRPCDSLRIALVDDVLTTGATAAALAAMLKDAGARRVEVWCLARTPAPGS